MEYNPKGKGMKGIEMTVVRAIMFVEAFEEWEAKQGKTKTWTEMDPTIFRKIYSDGWYTNSAEIDELYRRWKAGRLQQEIVELAANLNLDSLSKARQKEIGNAIRRFSD